MTESKYHTRLKNLLFNTCSKLTRVLIPVLIQKQRGFHDKSVDQFVQHHRELIEGYEIGKRNYKLFPTRGRQTKIEKWDIQLLCFIIKDILGQLGIPWRVMGDVEDLRRIRNTLCHCPDTLISLTDYIKYLMQIKDINGRFLDQIGDENLRQTINAETDYFINDRQNIHEALDALKDWLEKDKDLQREPCTLNEEQKKILTYLRSIWEKHKNIQIPDFQLVINIKNCNPEHEDTICRKFVDSVNEKVNQSPLLSQKDEVTAEIGRIVEKTFKEFFTDNQIVVGAELGCVIIKVKSETFRSLEQLWTKCVNGELSQAFNALQTYLRATYQNEVEIEVMLPEIEFWEVIRKIVNDLKEETSEKRNEESCLEGKVVNIIKRPSSDNGTDIEMVLRPKTKSELEYMRECETSGKLNESFRKMEGEFKKQLNLKDITINAKLSVQETRDQMSIPPKSGDYYRPSSKAVPHQAQIRDQTYLNWVRAGLGLKYTKEGIESFIDKEARVFHSSLLNQLGQPPRNCGQCTVDNLLPHHPSSCQRRTNCICSRGPRNTRRFCPISVCGTLFDAIVSEHRFKGPSWKNSDISQWVKDPWEVVKNFLPNTGGYKNVKSARDTDLFGLVNIGINMENITHRHNLTVSSVDGPDVFFKCRRARNEILHNLNQSLTDDQLTGYLNDMKATLQCTTVLLNDPAAQQAITKLTLLKTSVFEITGENIPEVKQSMALSAIINEGRKQVEFIKEEGEKQKRNVGARYQEEKNKLKRHLIENYIAQLQPATLPEVDRLYVEPSLELVTYNTREANDNNDTDLLEDRGINMNNVFFQDETQFSRIYISGDAGHGKTALCKMLVLAWCQEHSGDKINEHIPKDFLTVMRKFDFLFYITLTNIRKDWIISEMIKKQYFKDSEFLDMFIKNECNKNSCLVILDGLDEWTLPDAYETPMHTTHGLPDLYHFETFTVLTTTRPWKPEELRLGPLEMDRQVQLKGIDRSASDRYIKDMVDLLNKKINVRKNSEDFQQQLEDKHLEHFLNIPILLKYLIMLWHHDEKYITGSSQVHLYSALINQLLKTAWKRNKINPLSAGNIQETELPLCLKEKQYCTIHKSLLLSLAQLAFTSAAKRELVLDHVESQLQNLSEDNIQSCLTSGLLCQEIYASPLEEEKKKLSFFHKSFQDFLAAVFLVMNPKSAQLPQTCNTFHKILNMHSLFIFVSGLDSKVMTSLSYQIQKVMEKDEEVKQYKNQLDLYKLKPIQDLLCECVGESKESGQPLPDCHLETVVISHHTDWKNLQHLISTNMSCINYVYIDVVEDPYKDLITCLVSKCWSVQHLSLKFIESLPQNMEALLDKALCDNWPLSSLTLNRSLCEPCHRYLCSDRVTTLNMLVINYADISSDTEYQKLVEGVEKVTKLKTLEMRNIVCCNREKCSHHLDLSHCSQLQKMSLEDCDIMKVEINTASLTYCEVSGTPVHFAPHPNSGAMLQTLKLRNIEDPHSLQEIGEILHDMTQLSHLNLQNITCGEKKHLNHLDLSLCSKLQSLTLNDCDVIEVEINTASLTYCEVSGTPVHFAPHPHSGAMLQTLKLRNMKDSCYLNEIVTILPHLTQLSCLELHLLDFGDKDICLSPKATHLETVKLDRVIMTDRAMIKFLDSVLTANHQVDCEIKGTLNEAVDTHITDKFVVTQRCKDSLGGPFLCFYSQPSAP